jgi:hypothetical protein
MKIRDIITEGSSRTDAPTVGNAHAKIARSAKQAAAFYFDADKGAIEDFDPKEARKRVRELYGVELVDDFVDNLELPNGHDTDKAMSMFSNDMRK